jgi:hypothetical protein
MQVRMVSPVTRPISEMSLSSDGRVACRLAHSQIECQVMGLYDQFRNPLLRYVLSFGIWQMMEVCLQRSKK